MGTVRKIICLIIIMVMALGIVQITRASDFTDSDRIKYNEAVDVLVGIEVIEGFPDGSFSPLSSVTRAQAATILARMLISRSVADALPDKPTGFPDVDGVSGVGFALKYISYCVSKDIVVGYPDGTFRPNNPVTAAQFAVMLMRALNIGDPDRYIGPEWEEYAILYGKENNLLDTNVNYTTAANREQTAKYAFNGLLYSPGGQTVVIAKDSLAAKLYPTLQKAAEGVDALGSPGIVWTYGAPAKVIHSNAVSASIVQLALVIGFDSKTSQTDGKPTTTYTARIVDASGVASSVPIAAEVFNETGRDAKYRGVVCVWSVTANGLYTFTAPAVSVPADYLIDRGITGILYRGKTLMGTSTIKIVDSSTKFVVVNYSGSGSNRVPDGTVTIYSGNTVVPNLSLLTKTTVVSFKSGSNGPDNIADIIYIYDDIFNPQKDSYVYITGAWSQTSEGYVVDVITKGVRAGILVKDEIERDKLADLEGLLLKDVSITSSGVITPGEVWNAKWSAASSIQNRGGILILDDKLSRITIEDEVPIYTISVPASGPKDATVSTETAYDLYTAISLESGDFAYVVEHNGEATVVYIIVGNTPASTPLYRSDISFSAGSGVIPAADADAPVAGDPKLPAVTSDTGYTVTYPGVWTGLVSGKFPASGKQVTYKIVLAAKSGYMFADGADLSPANFAAPGASVDIVTDGYTLTMVYNYSIP